MLQRSISERSLGDAVSLFVNGLLYENMDLMKVNRISIWLYF